MPGSGAGKLGSAHPWHDERVFDGAIPPLTELADRLSALARLDAEGAPSPQRILRAAVELAGSAAPGAAGASLALWRPAGDGWDAEVRVATLPDTARLDDVELAAGAGPALAALTEDAAAPPVDVPDLLADRRWPAYAAAAVMGGVRAVRAVGRPVPGGRVTLTLHAITPRGLTDADTAVAVLVLAQTAAALSNAERYGAARRDAHQLTEAMRARAVIEQAKGVLVAATGRDPDAAFAELRRRSQAENVRLADVAARVVAQAARGVPGG